MSSMFPSLASHPPSSGVSPVKSASHVGADAGGGVLSPSAVDTTVDTTLDMTFDSTVTAGGGGDAVQKRDDIDSPYRATVRLEPQAALEQASAEEGGEQGMEVGLESVEPNPMTTISTRELNYDVSPTKLYALVEKRQWESVEQYLSTIGPSDAYEQASTWMLRKEKDGKLRWRLLPLHGAIIFRGPPSVVTALLKSYPGAARCKDDQGMLPLHLAFRNDAPDTIIDEVLSANPDAVTVKDRKGRQPLTCAMGSNCTKKSRAKLLATYTGIAVHAEQDQLGPRLTEAHRTTVAEMEAKHEAEMAELRSRYEEGLVTNDALKRDLESRHEAQMSDLKASYEETLVENLAVKKEKDDGANRERLLRSELAESQEREAELTAKVSDLTKALQAMTSMRRAETQRFNEESSQWSRVSQDLIQKMTAVQVERDTVANEVEAIREEKDRASVQKDVLRTSIDELVVSHKSLQVERDDLEARNRQLTNLMEQALTEQNALAALFNKLDQDMAAAATVRERMITSITKQEADVHALASKEHDAMRGILARQKQEMEDCLRNGLVGHLTSSQQQQQQHQTPHPTPHPTPQQVHQKTPQQVHQISPQVHQMPQLNGSGGPGTDGTGGIVRSGSGVELTRTFDTSTDRPPQPYHHHHQASHTPQTTPMRSSPVNVTPSYGPATPTGGRTSPAAILEELGIPQSGTYGSMYPVGTSYHR